MFLLYTKLLFLTGALVRYSQPQHLPMPHHCILCWRLYLTHSQTPQNIHIISTNHCQKRPITEMGRQNQVIHIPLAQSTHRPLKSKYRKKNKTNPQHLWKTTSHPMKTPGPPSCSTSSTDSFFSSQMAPNLWFISTVLFSKFIWFNYPFLFCFNKFIRKYFVPSAWFVCSCLVCVYVYCVLWMNRGKTWSILRYIISICCL